MKRAELASECEGVGGRGGTPKVLTLNQLLYAAKYLQLCSVKTSFAYSTCTFAYVYEVGSSTLRVLFVSNPGQRISARLQTVFRLACEVKQYK